MTTLGRAMTAMVIGLSASMLAPIAGEVQAASIVGQCQQQVARLWPQSGVEYERTKEDVLNACVANGGRIPG
jgi:hypothetical protein